MRLQLGCTVFLFPATVTYLLNTLITGGECDQFVWGILPTIETGWD